MFSFFKKRIAPYPTESAWTVLRGNHGGKPMFLRRNDSAADFAGHPDYLYRVGVAIPLLAPNEDGLPSNKEMEQLNAIEDSLAMRLQSNQESLQVLAITTGGMREFVFYTRAPAVAQAVIEEFRTKVTPHELQGYVAKDPKWQMFKQFA